jgi:adenylate kinase family enzyme
MMRRLLVVGPVSAGKTRLSLAVAERTGLPHVELDAVRFDANWNQLSEAEFREHVQRLAAESAWIIDGNYASVRDIVWRRADTIAWLDYSKAVVLRRILWRTLRRIALREDLGDGRRERWTRLVGADSIILWAVKSHGALRKEYERATEVYGSDVLVVRLRSPRETQRWLEHIESTPRAD